MFPLRSSHEVIDLRPRLRNALVQTKISQFTQQQMTSSIARRNGAAPVTAGMSPEEWEILKSSICKGFTDVEAKVFAGRCQALGLSPLSGQITAFKQGGGVTPIVTIDGYRSIAASVDPGYCVEIEYLVDGAWVDWLPDEPATQARARVFRTGQERPVVKAVSRKEFAGNSGPWRSMPNHMLAKVAESHALRMAYPQALAGTYSQDEMVKTSVEEIAVRTEINAPAQLPAKVNKKASLASETQLQTIAQAMLNVLNDVGREAFLINIKAGFGIEELNKLPAEHFDKVMKTLADQTRVDMWNQGKDTAGNQVVSEERIAELIALSSTQDPVMLLEDQAGA